MSWGAPEKSTQSPLLPRCRESTAPAPDLSVFTIGVWQECRHSISIIVVHVQLFLTLTSNWPLNLLETDQICSVSKCLHIAGEIHISLFTIGTHSHCAAGLMSTRTFIYFCYFSPLSKTKRGWIHPLLSGQTPIWDWNVLQKLFTVILTLDGRTTPLNICSWWQLYLQYAHTRMNIWEQQKFLRVHR